MSAYLPSLLPWYLGGNFQLFYLTLCEGIVSVLHLLLTSPKVMEISSNLTGFQQGNVILSAGAFVLAMGAVSRENEES